MESVTLIPEVLKHGTYWNLINYYKYYKTNNVNDNFHKIVNSSRGVLIDSGAFTFQRENEKDKIDWVNYTENYAKFIEKYDQPNIDGYFEMDIDNIIGYDNVLKLRSILEEVSDKIIPVWHKNRGIEDFKNMCRDYDYVAITAMSTDVTPEQIKLFTDYAHNENTRIHCLGMTQKKILNSYPIDSVDSTSWKTITRYGKLKNKKLNSDYIRNNVLKLDNYQYMQWMKTQKHYYNKWFDICKWSENGEVKL